MIWRVLPDCGFFPLLASVGKGGSEGVDMVELYSDREGFCRAGRGDTEVGGRNGFAAGQITAAVSEAGTECKFTCELESDTGMLMWLPRYAASTCASRTLAQK